MKPVEITDANFSEEVTKSTLPVLVDFWATWCGPCRAIAPIVEELAVELEGKVKIGKLDVDNNPETANQFGIRGIPTILIFKGGNIVDTVVGMTNKQTLLGKLTPHFS